MTRTKQTARKRRSNAPTRPIDPPDNNSADGPPPSKKAKTNPPLSSSTDNNNTPASPRPSSTFAAPPTAGHHLSASARPATASTSQSHSAASAEPSALDADLKSTHDVTSMSIMSSSHIRQKVTRILDLLSLYPPPPHEKPIVVMLHAKAPCAAKMISIAEIAKREIAKEGGKWFQYNRVEVVMAEIKEATKKCHRKEGLPNGKSGEEDDGAGGGEMDAVNGQDTEVVDEESTAFETMKTPFERANEHQPKLRAVPVMSVFLSRVRIDGLRRAYGEQTNALPLQEEKA